MSSYFFRHCLVFSLMTMCRLLGSASLSRGAVASEFICRQWERNRKHADVYITA